MRKLPDGNHMLSTTDANATLNTTLVDLLKDRCGCSDEQKLRRGKKLPKKVVGLKDVVPGRSLEIEDNPFSAVVNDVQPIDYQLCLDQTNLLLKNYQCCSSSVESSVWKKECLICHRAKHEDKRDDDGERIMCPSCYRPYHKSCLTTHAGEFANCIYCDFESDMETE